MGACCTLQEGWLDEGHSGDEGSLGGQCVRVWRGVKVGGSGVLRCAVRQVR